MDMVKGKGAVYVYCRDTDTCNMFAQNADKEGVRFGDGVSATARKLDGIMCLHEDGTIAYPGYIGHMAFAVGQKDGKAAERIDYAKYAAGEEDYYYCN